MRKIIKHAFIKQVNMHYYISPILNSMMRAKNYMSREETSQMTKLEELFHNKFLTGELLHRLIALYVKAVEIFNEQYGHMRAYFLDKMQFVISRPECLKMLEKTTNGTNVAETIRETIRMTEKERQEEEEMQRRIMNEIQRHEHQEGHYPHSFYEKERNNKIGMQMKMMKEVEENMKQISKQAHEADQKLEEKQKAIRNIQKDQQQKLEERRAKRRKKLRKKSFEIQRDKPDEQKVLEPVIQKEQLIEVQRQLTEAIVRFTVRQTIKQQAKEQEQGQKVKKKGRVKMQQIEEEEDEPGVFNISEQRKPTQGRIKTRRIEDDQDYW